VTVLVILNSPATPSKAGSSFVACVEMVSARRHGHSGRAETAGGVV